MSKKNILIIGILILIILGTSVYFCKINEVNPNSSSSPTATETSKPPITPTSDNNISDWQEYNSNLTTTYLFKDLKAPFLFKYPKKWNLDEGLSGIQIYSSNDRIGYEIGTVPTGKFMIQISPDIEDKNNEEIKSWCKNNLYDSPIKEFLSEKYIEVDGNKSYSVDYKIRSGNLDLIRQVCIAKSGLKVIIYAEPLDSNYLAIFDKILSTLKFIE